MSQGFCKLQRQRPFYYIVKGTINRDMSGKLCKLQRLFNDLYAIYVKKKGDFTIHTFFILLIIISTIWLSIRRDAIIR
jgi:uncharacterized membrane protein